MVNLPVFILVKNEPHGAQAVFDVCARGPEGQDSREQQQGGARHEGSAITVVANRHFYGNL
jgi:hypothetical protein